MGAEMVQLHLFDCLHISQKTDDRRRRGQSSGVGNLSQFIVSQ